MKVRIKHTDIITDVEREPLGWVWNSIQGRVYLDKEELEFLDNDDNIDWKSFRTEAAKDILSNALIPYALKEFSEESINIDYWTDMAVEWADCLISKLKEKEEK